MSPTATNTRTILDDVQLQHGPADLLGRVLLKSYTASLDRGVRIRFGSFDELLATNESNSDSWKPLFPTFNPRYSQLSTSNAFCILGENERGEIVASQAARLYSWNDTNLAAELESKRMLYTDPSMSPSERWLITAPKAAAIRGNIYFSGASWYRPDFRGRQLIEIIPRFTRAYALGMWAPDLLVSFQDERIAAKGVIARSGFPNLQGTLQMEGSPVGTIALILAWMTPLEILADLERFALAAVTSDSRSVVGDRGAKNAAG